MPLFSIICTTYNSERDIENLLESINNQTIKDYEIVLVDGVSTDKTLEIASKYPQINILSEKDKGIYDAMNKGIEIAKGNWIIFMGSDDTFFDNNVLENISKMSDHENFDLIYGYVMTGIKSDIIHIPKYTKKIYFLNSIHHQGAFYNKNLFKNFKYDTNYKISSDYELNLKLFHNNSKAQFYNGKISIVGDFGVSSKINRIGYEEEITIRKKIISNFIILYSLNFSTIIRYNLKKIINKFWASSHLANRIG